MQARSAGDETAEALARLGAAYYRTFFADDPAIEEVETLARRALPLLEQAGDHAGLVHVWDALAYGVANWRCRYEDYAHGSEQALRHSRLAGQRRSDLFRLDRALAYGPLPADEALAKIDALLPENPHPSAAADSGLAAPMLGRSDEAAQLASEAGRRWRELTGDDYVDFMLGFIAVTAGDHEDAAERLRRFCDFARGGRRGRLPSDLRAAARPIALQARPPRRGRAARRARAHPRRDRRTPVTQALWRQVQALVHASRGQHAEAETLARGAVAVLEPPTP